MVCMVVVAVASLIGCHELQSSPDVVVVQYS